MKIFNNLRVINKRNLAAKTIISNYELFNYASESLLEDLGHINNNFKYILEIGARNGSLTDKLKKQFPKAIIFVIEPAINLARQISCNQVIVADLETIAFDLNIKFDLIISCMNLHACNQPIEFFQKCSQHLNEAGIIIGNFIGSQSLKNLRNLIVTLEDELKLPHMPHFSPLIQFHQTAGILQQAGFKEVITSREDIELEFNSSLDLMKHIQKLGESNYLNTKILPLSRLLYQKLLKLQGPFFDSLKIINFTASSTREALKAKI